MVDYLNNNQSGTYGWVFGQIRIDPTNPETIYILGVPLSRSWLHIRTLHPEFAGVSRVWRRGMQTEERFLDFGFETWPAYVNSPVRHVVEQRKLCRWRLDGAEPLPFPVQ